MGRERDGRFATFLDEARQCLPDSYEQRLIGAKSIGDTVATVGMVTEVAPWFPSECSRYDEVVPKPSRLPGRCLNVGRIIASEFVGKFQRRPRASGISADVIITKARGTEFVQAQIDPTAERSL